MLMGAHLGSFEVLHALGWGAGGLKVAMLMYADNARKLNATLAAINPEAMQDIIALGRVESMLEVRDKLDDGYMVGMLADRTLGDDAVDHGRFPGTSGAVSGRALAHGGHAAAPGVLHDRPVSGGQPLSGALRATGRFFPCGARANARRPSSTAMARLCRLSGALCQARTLQLVQFFRFLAYEMKRFFGWLFWGWVWVASLAHAGLQP